jgi:flavin-dependent dehydrogenase
MTIVTRPGQRVDVCIIGAGPAGNALAIRLAQLGHDVCMVERSVFPRAHIGESLSPGIWPQLELLRVARTVAAASFWPCRTSLVQWEGDVAVRRDFGAGGGLLVDRGRFDALLLDRARAHGVRVMQPAVVRTRTRDDQGWHLDIQSADRAWALDADFLADASGRSAVLRGRKQRAGHRTLALYGYWHGGSLPHEPRIEAGHDAWYWGVPLPDGTYNAMVFLDAADFRARRARSLSATYHALIGHSGLMAGCRDIRLAGRVRAADATPYLDSDSIGPRSIKIGDAALALDPLSSSGVQKAINTALIGAVVINTLLRCPERASAASRFYTGNLTEASDRHRRWAAQHYAAAAATRPGRFWQTRAAGAVADPQQIAPPVDLDAVLQDDLAITLSPDATLVPEPCIVAGLIAMKPALHHPFLEQPVAFLGGFDVATLLRALKPGVTIGTLMRAWQIPASSKPAIAGWLLKHHVLRRHHPRNQTKEGCCG